MKQIIEQIQKIKGVKTITPYTNSESSEQMVIVVFGEKHEPERQILSKDELIDGEIYFVVHSSLDSAIFRYRDGNFLTSCYSCIAEDFFDTDGRYCEDDEIKELRHSVGEEKKTLIKAEIENRYFHELEK